MKTKEEILNLVDVILSEVDCCRRLYNEGEISRTDYLKAKNVRAHQIQILLWTCGVKRCYFEAWGIQETFDFAIAYLAQRSE